MAKVCVVVGSDSENALEFKKTTATAGAGMGIAQTLFTVSQVYVYHLFTLKPAIRLKCYAKGLKIVS